MMGQYNPSHEERIKNLLNLDGDLSWKESTKFSTNTLIIVEIESKLIWIKIILILKYMQ